MFMQHHNDTIITTDARRRKAQEDFFNKILPLALFVKGSKGLFKGCI